MLATDPTRLVALLLAAAAVTVALNTTVLPDTADTEDTPAFLPTISTTASTTASTHARGARTFSKGQFWFVRTGPTSASSVETARSR